MDEVIETKAAWGKTFVEIIDPTKENHVFRVYFEQPEREFIGLTDEEFDFLVPYCFTEFDLNDYKEFARNIEDKLRSKNNNG